MITHMCSAAFVFIASLFIHQTGKCFCSRSGGETPGNPPKHNLSPKEKRMQLGMRRVQLSTRKQVECSTVLTGLIIQYTGSIHRIPATDRQTGV